MDRGRPGFRLEFAVSRNTQVSDYFDHNFTYETLTLFGHLFHGVLLSLLKRVSDPTTPLDLRRRFGLSPFRSSLTRGLSFDFFSSPYLDISVQEVPDPAKCGDPRLRRVGFPIRTPTD